MVVVQKQQHRGGMRRKRAAVAGKGSCGAGWVVVVSQALLLLTPTCAFQLQPPISPPSTNVNHSGCDLARRAAAHSSSSNIACPATAATVARARRAVTALGAAGADDGDESFAEDKRYRRKPKGANLRRDAAGLPSEKVYAPRQSA